MEHYGPNTDSVRSDPYRPDEQVTDFDVRGLTGIRVLNGRPRHHRMLLRQLGLVPAPLRTEPGVFIEFVDRMDAPKNLRYVGVDDTGYAVDEFFLLRPGTTGLARAQVPFGSFDEPVRITCEHEIRDIPFLIQTLNLAMVARGVLPMHASAFSYRGKGILTTGWSQGGKTEILLGFMANGAQLIGDEWVYVGPDRARAVGLPLPIRVRDWHISELPRFWSKLSVPERMRLAALGWGRRVLHTAGHAPALRDSTFGRNARKGVEVVGQRAMAEIEPRALFGNATCTLEGSVDKVFFVGVHDRDDVSIERVEPGWIAGRMSASLEYERLRMHAYHLKYRFAFPDRANSFLEQAAQSERDLLAGFLADKETYAIHHPHPVSIPRLFEALRPFSG